MNKQALKVYLQKLGLSREMASVYMELLERGASTPLSIARHTEINRTKVYRLLEEMGEHKLVTQEVGEQTTRYSPAPAQQLQTLLRGKQARVAELTGGWREAAGLIEQMSLQKESETRVKFYQGRAGLEQMVWNVLRAKSEIVGYTYRDLSEFVGVKFMSEFALEFTRRNLKMRDIYGDEYQENKHEQYEWGGRIETRYLPRETLSIPHQMDIYNEVVALYGWSQGEVWGTEIYNEKVAKMQRQLFELAWIQAKKVV